MEEKEEEEEGDEGEDGAGDGDRDVHGEIVPIGLQVEGLRPECGSSAINEELDGDDGDGDPATPDLRLIGRPGTGISEYEPMRLPQEIGE